MPALRTAGKVCFLAVTCAILLFSLSLISPVTDARTIIFGGQVSSQGTATITQTITIANLTNLPKDAYVTFNAPVFGDFADDGFSQTITGQEQTVSRTPASVTDKHDVSGSLDIHYKQYKWSLNNLSDTTFTVAVTTTVHYVVTANPQPYAFTDAFTSPGGVTAGAATEAEAVDKVVNYVKLNDPGNCVGRADLMLSLLQGTGIQARVVHGVTVDTPYETPEFVIDNVGYQLIRGWGKELHAWVEVYYPDEGRWVSYDPAANKGFVDQRHLAMGTSPSTDSVLSNVQIYANPGISRSLGSTLTFTGVTDSGSYVFRHIDPEPAGLDLQDSMIGRDMVNAPTPTPTPVPTLTPTPTPTPTPVPDATPIVNATITPSPNATVTPTPAVNATVTPSPAPSGTTANNGTNVTGDTGITTYNISGRIIDASLRSALENATMSLDGQPVHPGPDGTFSISVANGTHSLKADAPGYGTATMSLTVAGADISYDVQLYAVAPGTPGGESGWPIPGFGLIAALAGLLIIALYRYGRA